MIETELAGAVDVIVTLAKRIPFLWSKYSLKEIENTFSVCLMSYRNTQDSLGEFKKLWEHELTGKCSHSISFPPKLPLVFLELTRNMKYVFYFFVCKGRFD